MNYLQIVCAVATVALSVVTMTRIAYAAPSDTAKSTVSKTVKTKASKSSGTAVTGQTDIVAKVDLPMVTNIMPWQEKEGSIPKNILDFSALKDSMTPTDRDRLAGEIRYTSILNKPVDQQ